MRIIFLGTPDFAAFSLYKMIEAGFNIVAVITSPDKPAGRGLKLKPSPVKELALKANIPVLQPTNLKSPDFLKELKSYNADIQCVIAFRMLPQVVWEMPPLGTFNLHASLLPNYRGAAPINWAIINGEKETGVTTFFLKHEIDTGQIIFNQKVKIEDSDNVGTLHDKLMHVGADLVLKTIRAIEANNYPSTEQVLTGNEKHAPKIFRDTCKIDWNNSAEHIRNLIRGLSPYPSAFCAWNQQTLKIFRVEFASNFEGKLSPGEIKSEAGRLFVGTTDQPLEIFELQPESKKRMNTKEFLNGFNNSLGNFMG